MKPKPKPKAKPVPILDVMPLMKARIARKKDKEVLQAIRDNWKQAEAALDKAEKERLILGGSGVPGRAATPPEYVPPEPKVEPEPEPEPAPESATETITRLTAELDTEKKRVKVLSDQVTELTRKPTIEESIVAARLEKFKRRAPLMPSAEHTAKVLSSFPPEHREAAYAEVKNLLPERAKL